jgi:glyoxylase-like metal-dependent hydrolase (beta-lactamase superfamily II)
VRTGEGSYLIYGDKVALVDASHEKFRELYLETLKEELRKAGRGIDYIFISHTEPDHSGMLPPGVLVRIPVRGTPGQPWVTNHQTKQITLVDFSGMFFVSSTRTA